MSLSNIPVGEPIKKLECVDGSVLDFMQLGSYREPYCMDVITKYIQKYQVNVFGILLDTFMVYPKLLQIDIPCKSFFYFPSDGGGHLPLGCDNILKKVSLPIAMSKFGQKQVKDIHGIDAIYIPHGVDTSLFNPMPNKDEVKSRVPCYMFNHQGLIPTPGILNGKFVIGSVYRNQPRKMADRMFKAFAKFAKGRDDVILYLHTDPFDAAASFDVLQLMIRLDILHKVVFTGMDFIAGCTLKQLNEIYNAMDCFFLSTSGEGFGIPTLEAMSCGVPPIVTDGTTTPELLMENGQCGLPVKLVGTEEVTVYELMKERGYDSRQVDEFISNGTIVGSWNVDRNLMDIDHAIQCLNKLYSDKELRANLGKVGREKACKYYDWNMLLPIWDKVLTGLVEE